MLELTQKYIHDQLGVNKSDQILMAVSGGIDSMLMSHLLKDLGYRISIAHCNFSLRGNESDGDEDFVREYASREAIPFFTKKFSTSAYAGEHGLSIQMAARELRYNWFDELCNEHKFDYVAVAHNSNDVVETLLINLVRGTGLKGLTGIKPKNGKIIRPLLFASRDQIEEYAHNEKIGFREDSSNLSTDYHRNRIRHNIIPELLKINPSFTRNVHSTVDKLSGTSQIFDEYIESVKSRIFVKEENSVSVSVNDLAALKPSNAWLFEIFREYNIGPFQLEELKKLFYAESGKFLNTISHTIYKDRERLIISPSADPDKTVITLNSFDDLLTFRELDSSVSMANEFKIIKDSAVGCLDLGKLEFPLVLRPWKEGDSFIPLGLKGRKKLSDLFTDLKIPMNIKPGIKVLCSGDEICWVVGYRVDDRFKVTADTEQVLIVKQNRPAIP